jgi:hypothetical protein
MAHPGPVWRRKFVLWRDCRPGTPPAPEAADVRTALAAYTDDGGLEEWVPAAVLYRTYREWYARHRSLAPPVGDEAPDLLTLREFGFVLRRVFSAIRRVKRWEARGRVAGGYAHLRGPGALRSPWTGRRPATRYRHGWRPVVPPPPRYPPPPSLRRGTDGTDEVNPGEVGGS